MPLLSMVTTAAPAEPEARRRVLTELSALLAEALGKPEAYVMVTLSAPGAMSFGGTETPACYAELKNVGTLPPARIAPLSETLCSAIATQLGVAKDRIYIEFTNADGAFWGWNGATFS
jgi:phenylpyruvate tautomerase PptA (4-oxalocrotonate tautomerase family)